MRTIGILLDILSAVMFLGVAHQIFAKKSESVGGLGRHVVVGYLCVFVPNIVVAILVAIRGIFFEGAMNTSLKFHIATGIPAIVLVFITKHFGERLRSVETRRRRMLHRSFGYATGLFLLANLILGIMALLGHNH